MRRKIIQLVGPSAEWGWKFVALCDDGTWWYLESCKDSEGGKTTNWWQGLPMVQHNVEFGDDEETP